MEYTILILLLPFLSFLLLGICGKWLSHKAAGLVGTCVLGMVAVLSYATAYGYFTMPRTADGVFETIVPYNINWLPFSVTLVLNSLSKVSFKFFMKLIPISS